MAGRGRAVLGPDPPVWRNSLKFSKFENAACALLRRREGGRICSTAGLSNERGSHGAVRQDAASAAKARPPSACSGSQAPAQTPAGKDKAYRSPLVPSRIENVGKIRYICSIMVHLLSSITKC